MQEGREDERWARHDVRASRHVARRQRRVARDHHHGVPLHAIQRKLLASPSEIASEQD
jgi:hypothetical protein